MSNRFFRVFIKIFIVVGAAGLIAAGVMLAVMLGFRHGASVAQGELVYQYSGGFAVSFTADDGRQYTVPMDYTSTSFAPGQRVTLYYRPDNPMDIQTASLPWFSAIPGGIGLIFLLVGLGFWGPAARGDRRKNYLLENGRRVFADVESVQINYRIRMNGVCPYYVLCQYTDPSGLTHAFRSGNIWDLQNFTNRILQNRENQTLKPVPVYVDGDNYKKYYVDVDSLNFSAS